MIFFRARQIHQTGKPSAGKSPAAAGHDIAVHIHGIDGVLHGHNGILGKEFLETGRIAFGAVTDENFIFGNVHSARAVVMLRNRFAQKVIAFIRAVPAEGFGAAHFFGGFFERFHHGGGQRTADVAYTQTDNLLPRMCGFVSGGAAGHFGKQVTALQI